jgi:hypothetical protein
LWLSIEFGHMKVWIEEEKDFKEKVKDFEKVS